MQVTKKKPKAPNATEPKDKKWYLNTSSEELLSGNHLYFIKSNQILFTIISRRIEDKISKWNPLLEIQFLKRQKMHMRMLWSKDKGE